LKLAIFLGNSRIFRVLTRLHDEESGCQENREEFLAAKSLPKNNFQKPCKAIDFQQENRLIF
jgi:hypothetical protein